jgi:TPR repeat protein
MKQGFFDMENNYPHSPAIQNNYFRFACIAKDKETVRRLFNKIGDNWYSSHHDDYDQCRELAGIQGKSWAQIHQEIVSLENKQLIKLAQEGDPKSQWLVGNLYHYNVTPKVAGFSQDTMKTFEWYRKAAEQGYPAAQSTLGTMYNNGEGVAKNKKKAIELYRLAAEQGDCSGSILLAWAYKPWNRISESDYGVEPDAIQSYAWYVQCNNDTREWQEKMSAEELKKAKEEAEIIKKRIASKPKIFDPSSEGSIFDPAEAGIE